MRTESPGRSPAFPRMGGPGYGMRMSRRTGAAQIFSQGALRTTGPEPGPLALADINSDSVRVVLDTEGRLSPALLAYGRAAVSARLPEIGFLWYLDSGEQVRVRISPTAPGASTRELRLEAPGETYDLTRRELQVLTLACGGLSNQEIATVLGSSIRTVTTQVARVLMKMEQPARAGAVAVAMDQGLLCLPICGSLESFQGLVAGCLEAAVRGEVADPARPPARRQQIRPAPLRIGHLVPATFLNEGADMRQGGQLAVEQINARGGVAGRLLEQVAVSADVFDIGTLPASIEALGAAGIDALVVGYNGDYEQMDIFLRSVAELGVPIMHASTSGLAADIVSENPGLLSNVFQLCGPDRRYGPGFVRFVTEVLARSGHDLRTRSIAVVDPPPGMTVLDEGACAALDRAGWRLIHIERQSARCDPAQIARIVAEVCAVEADLVFVPSFFDEQLLRAVMTATALQPFKPLVYSLFTPAFAGFLDRHGDVAEGVVWATQTGTYPDRIGVDFRTAFETRFGRSPGFSQASVHYDAVHLLTRAWLEMPNPRRTSEAVRRIRDLVHRGVNGAYSMNDPTQSPRTLPDLTLDASIAQAQLVYQVQNGRHVVVAPAPYTQAALKPR